MLDLLHRFCVCVCVSERESFLHNSPSGKVKASLGDGMKENVKPHQSLRIPNRASYGEADGECLIIPPGGRRTINHGHRKDACRLHHTVPPGLGNCPYPPTLSFIFSSLPSSFLWDVLSPLASLSVLSQCGFLGQLESEIS